MFLSPSRLHVADEWWRLPGPMRFLRDVVARLVGGETVVLALPMHGPEEILGAVQQLVREDGTGCYCHNVRWERQSAVAGELSPASVAEFVQREMLSGQEREPLGATDPALRMRAATKVLVGCESLRGDIVCVRGVDGGSWPAWREFLRHYAHVRRNAGTGEAVTFCVCATGVPSGEHIDDAGLTTSSWRGVVGRLDTSLHAASYVTETHPLRRRLQIALAVEIAGTDLGLAAELARQPLVTCVEPRESLKAFGAARGWGCAAALKPCWHEGTADRLDGEDFVHSSVLAATSPGDIEARVWRAQVGVLFPLIETHRLKLIKTLNGQLRVPIETPFGTIDDVRDLEIGQIEHQLRGVAAPASVKELVRSLARMRRALAHLEPVEGALLANGQVIWQVDTSLLAK